MSQLLHNVYEHIKGYDMVKQGDRILFGLSGGADSVSMILALCRLADKLGTSTDNYYAVHVNHMLRGEEADRDEKFSEELCARLGVTFISYRKNVSMYARKNHCSLEEAGRICRYECFKQAARKYKCDRIAVAHNKNDLAETVIFNLVRGSGLKGVGGIPAVRGNIIRPMLNVGRNEIEAFLKEENQDFCIDRTNSEMDYDRNFVRSALLPLLGRLNGGALEHICQTAAEAKESYEYIHGQALSEYEGAKECAGGRTVSLDINMLKSKEPLIREHIVHEAVADVAGGRKDLTRRHIMSAAGLINRDTGKAVMLPYGISARRSYNELIITNADNVPEEYVIEIEEDGVYEVPSWGKILVGHLDHVSGRGYPKDEYTKMFDYGKLNDRVCIRTPQEGDYIIIDSEGNRKKLSRVFIDNKIDRELRSSWPVLACGDEIIWALGLRYNVAYGIDENTKKVLYIECLRKGESDGR